MSLMTFRVKPKVVKDLHFLEFTAYRLYTFHTVAGIPFFSLLPFPLQFQGLCTRCTLTLYSSYIAHLFLHSWIPSSSHLVLESNMTISRGSLWHPCLKIHFFIYFNTALFSWNLLYNLSPLQDRLHEGEIFFWSMLKCSFLFCLPKVPILWQVIFVKLMQSKLI